MKLNFADERVMAVVAHPDDAELLCAGMLARAKGDGAAVAICVLCRGEKGQSVRPVRNLATVRRKEMTEAARLLGARLFPGNFSDGMLGNDFASRRKLIEIYRQFKPTLVLAHAMEDYHPDHRAASALAEAASWFCASRGHLTRFAAMSSPPTLWWMDTIGMSRFEPGFFIDITLHVELKERMLACHRSQLQRGKDRDFAPLAPLMRHQCQTRGAQCGVTAAEAFRIHHAFKRGAAF